MYKKYVTPDFMPTREQMLSLIAGRIQPVQGTEIVFFSGARGRIAAEDIRTQNTLPNTPVSRLDGIGVRFADFAGGIPDTSAWTEGSEYYFSNTGVALRDGFDTVIRIEDVDVENGKLIIHRGPSAQGELVGAAGEHIAAGEILVPKGCRLTPAHIGLLASGGVMSIPVTRRARVAILPTGDELLPAGSAPARGKNIESNSHMLAAYIEEWGAEPYILPILSDEFAAIKNALSDAVRLYDAAVVIAGSSKGTADYTLDALAALGEVLVPEMAHGPGKHSSLTLAGHKPLIGVSGPPMGAQVFAELYLRPIIFTLLGLPAEPYPVIEAVIDEKMEAYEVDFCQKLHVYRAPDGYHAKLLMTSGPRTRTEMVALANATLYQKAGCGHEAGMTAAVELMTPYSLVPAESLL
ncbi:MAG: molybdopterin molybdotransferase MoeA [Gracilibacteraceae bacterium]|nr:molybdopterin molybdotransferase MoeA [Gracilibacteraceae bacterium]